MSARTFSYGLKCWPVQPAKSSSKRSSPRSTARVSSPCGRSGFRRRYRKTDWPRSAREAAEMAMTRWVRMKANHVARRLRDHRFGERHRRSRLAGTSLQDLVRIAYRDRMITTVDHAVVTRLRGHLVLDTFRESCWRTLSSPSRPATGPNRFAWSHMSSTAGANFEFGRSIRTDAAICNRPGRSVRCLLRQRRTRLLPALAGQRRNASSTCSANFAHAPMGSTRRQEIACSAP